MSPNGEPGGNSKPGNGLLLVITVCVVDMFTTDGINLSARSAKEDGAVFDIEVIEKLNAKMIDKKIILTVFILVFNIINYHKTQNCKKKSTNS
tara:strand:- start:66 stop:344 length:279 start_codon:yes stop_codon:yes gene_type:complete